MDGVMLFYILLVQCGTFWFVCALVEACEHLCELVVGNPSEINNIVCEEE